MKNHTIMVLRMGLLAILAGLPITALGMESANYQLNTFVVNAGSNTYTGNGKQVYDSVAESLVGQAYGRQYSVQAGFFNEYFLVPATPTVSPTVIRTFGSELMDEKYVFAAPNPIRGVKGNIYFDLAQSAEVWLKIYTPHNQLVMSQHWDSRSAGTNHWVWNAANLANGVYIVWIKAKSADGKTTVIKKKVALIK